MAAKKKPVRRTNPSRKRVTKTTFGDLSIGDRFLFAPYDVSPSGHEFRVTFTRFQKVSARRYVAVDGSTDPILVGSVRVPVDSVNK